MSCHTLEPMTTLSTVAAVERLAEIRALAQSGEARRIRQQARLSQIDVAGAIGVDPSTVSRWEIGTRRPHGAPAVAYAALLTRLKRRDA